MTNTNGYRNDARLNQLAATAAANTQAIAANTQAIAGLREQQELTNKAIDTLVDIVMGHQEQFATMLKEISDIKEEIRDIKTEIRGLQLENRRMLEELRGRRVDLLNERSI
jgi:chromosome segregation ATPase